MTNSVSNQTQIQELRPGDRLKYHGVQWQVKDYSTYDDAYGYETLEWLLQSEAGKEYYLLREIDPQNPEFLLNWYLAEEIDHPKIYQLDSYSNLAVSLWHDMQGQKTPYPELQALSRRYYFESQTQGNYEGDEGETSRITWDYWDKSHQWNLALEAWANGEMHVYSTKRVKPEEFSEIAKGGVPKWLRWLRVALGTAGFLMLLVGCLMIIFGG